MKNLFLFKTILVIGMLANIVSCSSSKSATDTNIPQSITSKRTAVKEQRQQARQQLFDDLHLREDQKAEVKTIVEKSQSNLQNLRNSDMDRRSKMEQMRSLSSDTDTKLRAILDDTQYQIYQNFKQKQIDTMREQMQNRRNNRRG